MPCTDSSSSIAFQLDENERFVSFEFAKITCGREITGQTGYGDFCRGKALDDILKLSFQDVSEGLKIKNEEEHFILYLEWDALRCVIAQYLGLDDTDIDKERCQITSIEHDEKGVDVALVILPPKEMPKILPCSLGD